MKNLLVYLSPLGGFDEKIDKFYRKKNPAGSIAKIQIDNSLDLGWKKEDIILLTNFEYEYNGVKSTLVPGDLHINDKTSNKMPVIKYLLDNKMLDNGELHWYHDFDVSQDQVITEEELGLEKYDLGLITYGYKETWNCGSFFFKTSAADIFDLLVERMLVTNGFHRCDEKTIVKLISNKEIDPKRYKKLDSTYNYMYKYIYLTYPFVQKPMKALHFYPYDQLDGANSQLYEKTHLDVIMYGKNISKKPLITDRLIKIFHKHGIS